MEDNGFRSNGKGILYDGRTGRMIRRDLRRRDLLPEKLHTWSPGNSRRRGARQILTRQPTEVDPPGRTAFGEMERDCLIGHGPRW